MKKQKATIRHRMKVWSCRKMIGCVWRMHHLGCTRQPNRHEEENNGRTEALLSA